MKKVGIIITVFIIILPIVTAADNTGQILVNIVDGDCILDFKEGWNLISFCKNLQDFDLTNVLTPIDGRYRYVMVWDKDNQEFQLYSPLSENNPFSNFNDDLSYFIYMWEPATLDILGNNPPTEPRDLIEGWTTPAYQYDFETTITDMFQNVWQDFRYIMKWNNINQEFDLYSPISENNPFDRVYPEEGRFIYMYNPSTITY